jgi:hypothetical protein
MTGVCKTWVLNNFGIPDMGIYGVEKHGIYVPGVDVHNQQLKKLNLMPT